MANFNRETNAKHEALVAAIIADHPGVSAKGFRAAVNALKAELGDEALPVISWRPDAYRINRQTREIEIYEVEVRHALPAAKVESLGELWFDWESEGEHDWLPVLIVVSRYGFHQRIDLKHAYYRTGPFAS